MLRIETEGLTFDDVLLVPSYSNILPKDVNVSSKLTRNISMNIPLVSAAMDTVTEWNMALAMGQEGGIGVIHKSMSIDDQAYQIKRIKKFESGVVKDPVVIEKDATIKQLLILRHKHNISGLPVMDKGQLVGIVTSRDVRFENDLSKKVHQVMTPKDQLVTVLEGTSNEKVQQLLHKHRIEKVLIVNQQFELVGLITVKDMDKAERYPLAVKDEQGRLLASASVGTSVDTQKRVAALVEAGVDVIVVDTSHGHSQNVLDQVKWIKNNYQNIEVVGGNIATAEGALALKDVGVDAVKVGIGPGSICTTRIVSGVGVPQITAISNVAQALKGSGIPVIADGGIRYSGDIAKALAAGASTVMMGGLLAGTDEAPGELEIYQGRSYKSYRGMGSIGAMSKKLGSSDRYFQDEVLNSDKLVPEGIEGRVPYKGPLSVMIHQMVGGLKASMGYTGCVGIEEMQQHAKFIKISSAGVNESHVHDVSITKESPNYQGRF